METLRFHENESLEEIYLPDSFYDSWSRIPFADQALLHPVDDADI